MVNFYRKFIKDAALILAPLTNALKGPDKQLVWSSTMECAFLQAKRLLSAMPILFHPEPGSAQWPWMRLNLMLEQFSSSKCEEVGFPYPSTPGS